MLCIYCNKEFDSKRATAKYCSPNCRKLAFLSVPKKEEVSVPNLSVPVVSVPSVTKLSKEELYSAIHSYKEDNWYDSPEYKELIRRLNSMSVSKLQEQGYHIPNWKLKNG